MLQPFPLQLSEANAVVLFDMLNLTITNGYYCNNLSVDASLEITFFFPAAYMPRSISNGYYCNHSGLLCSLQLRICRVQETCALPEAFGHRNRLSATKTLS